MRLLLSWKPWTERRITDTMHSKVGKNYRRPVREGSLVTRGGGGGGGGGTHQCFIRVGSAARSNPLPIYVPFLAEKVPLTHT